MKTFYMLNIFITIIVVYLNIYIRTCVGFPRNSNIHLNKRSARLTTDLHSYDRDIDHKKIDSYTLSTSISNQSINRQQDYENYDSIRGIRSYGKHVSKQKNKQKNKMKNKKKNKKYRLNKQLAADMKHPLNADDFRRAKLLTIEDYIYNQKVFTDDIIKKKTGRNAIRDQKELWPSGIVEYVISHEYPDEDRAKIAKAFEEYHEKTCIKFVPKNNTSDNKSHYIRIASVDSCRSSIGMTPDFGEVRLGDFPYSQLLDLKSGHKCFRVGTVIHELMHVIGFDHEHNRPDRDEHIKIIWDNIPKKLWSNFDKCHSILMTTLDEPYDFNSVMHYPLRYEEKDIIAPLKPLPKETNVGLKFGFSKIDLIKIEKLYKNECKNK